jgi:DNA-binding MarR family transcriptional regulator
VTPRRISVDALVSIASIRGELKRRVFRAIMDHDGATCDQLERDLDMKPQTLSARVRELWQEGFLRRSGKRRTRSGRLAVVYYARARQARRQPRERCPRCGQVVQ